MRPPFSLPTSPPRAPRSSRLRTSRPTTKEAAAAAAAEGAGAVVVVAAVAVGAVAATQAKVVGGQALGLSAKARTKPQRCPLRRLESSECLSGLLALSSAGNRFLVLTIGQHNLALKYYDEIGVAKDLAMARSWFQKSSDQNFGGFQRMLGTMMVKGAGGERLVTGGRSCKSSCKTRQSLCNRVATKTPQVPSKNDYGSIHFN